MKVGSRALTPRQLEWLKAIQDFIVEHRFPPTRKELSAIMGANPEYAIRALERKGYIRPALNEGRGIQLLISVTVE